MISLDLYKDLLPQTLPDWRKYINNQTKKWSDNITELFNASGKTASLESLKDTISNRVIKQNNFNNIFDKSKTSTLLSLKNAIESKIKSKTQ
jgi:hypothetical protein